MSENSLKKGRYTKFSNKIGLYSNSKGGFIKNDTDVVLNFPFKDAVLEAGMSKEDVGREERFLHIEVDSKDIDTLEEPKVLTDFCYIDKDGEKALDAHSDIEFFDIEGNLKQNLLIKGNNLLAMYTLRERLAGQVKLIYIDPPYNTGSDGFKYNDQFNHSSWLAFMKNRLEIAKTLLRDDGTIFISIDGVEFAYLQVLMDEIYGRENLLEVFHFQVRYANKSLNERDDFQPVIEYGLAYAKNKSNCKPNKPTEAYKTEKFNLDIQETGKPDRSFTLKDGRQVDVFLPKNYSIRKVSTEETSSLEFFKETWVTGSIYSDTGHGAMYKKAVEPFLGEDGYGVLYKIHGLGEDGLGFRYMTGPKKEGANFGKMYNKIPLDKKEGVLSGEYEKPVPITNFYDFSGDVGNIRHEGGVKFNKGKKPERMIGMLLDIFTQDDDIVLDYHVGSGTTSAVAHKMNRRWIGIEQIDYGKDDSKVRLINVVNGDETGISKSVSWQGGGSFIYFELKKYNQEYIDRIAKATSLSELEEIYVDMRNNAFLKFWFDRKEFEKDENFRNLDVEGRKQKLVDVLDENQLYLNYADMDDTRHKVTADEKTLTDKFYGSAKN